MSLSVRLSVYMSLSTSDLCLSTFSSLYVCLRLSIWSSVSLPVSLFVSILVSIYMYLQLYTRRRLADFVSHQGQSIHMVRQGYPLIIICSVHPVIQCTLPAVNLLALSTKTIPDAYTDTRTYVQDCIFTAQSALFMHTVYFRVYNKA